MLQTRQQRYDLPTAVTFFLAGLGVGSVLALLLSPRSDDRFSLPTGTGMRGKGQAAAL